MSEEASERKHPVFPVPEGFPQELDDKALDEWTTKLSDALRKATAKGVGFPNAGIVTGYGTMLDVARGEAFRRHLRRSEKVARVSAPGRGRCRARFARDRDREHPGRAEQQRRHA